MCDFSEVQDYVFFIFASVPGSSPYNVGQASCLIREYEAELAEAEIIRHCGSINNIYNPMNNAQLPAQSFLKVLSVLGVYGNHITPSA